MTQASTGDIVQICTAGTANAAGFKWRGGKGVLLIDNLSGTPSLEFITPSTAWVAVRDVNSGAVVTGGAAALYFNVELPAGMIRLSAGGGAMNAWVVGTG